MTKLKVVRPRKPAVNDWPAEDEAALVKMWADGLSASQCATALNQVRPGISKARTYTRSAVIGKVHRMGITDTAPKKGGSAHRRGGSTAPRPRPIKDKPPKRTNPFNFARTTAAAKLLAEKEAKLLALKEQDTPPLPSNAVRFMDRSTKQCSWPVGSNEQNEMMVCGGKVLTDKRNRPYCAHHQRKS
jgi:hypothetical protein